MLLQQIFAAAACAAWNPETVNGSRLAVSYHVRQIGWDMKVSEYEKTGFAQYQVDSGHHPHQIY